LIKPLITEAATFMAEDNKYAFKVANNANKQQVKKSIEELFKVSVISVRTINVPGKRKTRGRVEGMKSGYKKAIVTLKKGDSINVFEK
jgi:large subunit ribosomal protein L23